MDTTYHLAFYACATPGLGPRAVKRLSKGDTRTQFDGLLNAEAVRLDSYEEFERVSRGFMKGDGAFGAVLIEGSDGSRRKPLPSDFITPSLPVAPVAPVETPADVVSVSPLVATGGDTSTVLPRLKEIMAAATKPVRCDIVSTSLGVSKEQLRALIEAEGSGVLFKKPFGWLELLPEPEENLLD